MREKTETQEKTSVHYGGLSNSPYLVSLIKMSCKINKNNIKI